MSNCSSSEKTHRLNCNAIVEGRCSEKHQGEEEHQGSSPVKLDLMTASLIRQRLSFVHFTEKCNSGGCLEFFSQGFIN